MSNFTHNRYGPRPKSMNSIDSIKHSYNNLNNYKSRASRQELLYYIIFVILYSFVVYPIIFFIINFGMNFNISNQDHNQIKNYVVGFFCFILFFPMILFIVRLLYIFVRRLHDTNKSSFWQILYLIPIFGWCIFIVLLCQKSVDDRYE